MNERAVFIYVYNISKCTHRIRSMKRERYRFEIVMFVIVCYINIFDIHTDACQTAQHSFTDEYIRISNKIASPFYFLFHTFVWAVWLIGSFDAQSLCCVRSICLILSDRCQVENLVSIGLVCVLYFISCMKDKRCTHFSHRYFFSLHFTIVYQQLETGVRFAYLWNVCPIRCVTIWWLWLFDWGGFVLCQGSNAWYHHSTSANVIGFSLIVCVHVCSQR